LGNALYRLNRKPVNPFKVTAVVGEERQVVMHGSGANEQIEVSTRSGCENRTHAADCAV
jgi:hypothetical protein